MSTNLEVAEFGARHAIADLLYRYCRAVDRIDVPLGHSIWHDDGYADYGKDYYQGPGKGSIDLICQHHLATLNHSHQITNILIEVDGDQAASESYCFAALRIKKDDKLMQITVWSRYLDSWSRREGRWGLERRIAVRDFDEIREVSALSQQSVGQRDHSDPSYALLGNQVGSR